MTTRRAHRGGLDASLDPALGELARRHGVDTRYRAAEGALCTVDPDVVVAILAALGVDLRRPGGAAEAWRADEARRADRMLPTVVAHRTGHGAPVSVTVRLPAGVADAATRRRSASGARLSLVTEDGQRWDAHLGDVLGPAVQRQVLDGRDVTCHRVSLAWLGSLPLGYHRLTVEAAGTYSTATVVVAPPRCPPPPRTWGLSSPVYGLRTDDDDGSGTLTDLGALAEWAGSFGAGLTGTLPLYAAFLDGPEADPSPYRPASRLAWNEAFVDLRALPDVGAVPAAAGAMVPAGQAPGVAARRAATESDLLAVGRRRRRVLQPFAVGVLGGGAGPERRAAFDRWAADHPEVLAYARFRAGGADRSQIEPWPVRIDPSRSADVAFAYHCVGQWVADEQLAHLARRHPLYLDIPVGVHPSGFDPWWEPDAYVHHASIGAPPDLFFSGGQDWGLPPLHPDGIRRQGYRHLAAVLRKAMQRAAVVRLDHVMGLRRLWFVPAGHQASDGAYVHYRHHELRAVAVLEAHRAGAAVVGEDLGTVPDEVRRAMDDDGMLHSAVWQFAASPADPWPDPPAQSLASLATHDLPTFTAYVTAGGPAAPGTGAPSVHCDGDEPADGRAARGAGTPAPDETVGGGEPSADGGAVLDPDEAARRRALLRAVGPEAGDALVRCLVHLAAGPAAVVLVDTADLWLERRQQNIPGTSTGSGSFRLRNRRTLAELRGDAQAAALLAAVDASRRTGLPNLPERHTPRTTGEER